MTRHFLGLYLLIVLTLAAVSWGQDKLLQAYSYQDAPEDRSLIVAMAVLADQLRSMPDTGRKALLARTAAETGVDMELFATMDITGSQTLDKLKRGEITLMSAGTESWVLKQIDAEHVLAFRSIEPGSRRGPLE
jgi:hypothetical protein